MGTVATPPPPGNRGRRPFWASLNHRVLALGGTAAAVAGIVALGTQVFAWFDSPEGKITSLEIGRVAPLTYGEWADHERVPRDGIPADELRTPGRMIAFDVETEHFSADDELGVRIILHDVTHSHIQEFPADSIRVEAGDTCGCFEWVPVPRGNATYYLEVQLFPPGAVKGQPVRSRVTDDFKGS